MIKIYLTGDRSPILIANDGKYIWDVNDGILRIFYEKKLVSFFPASQWRYVTELPENAQTISGVTTTYTTNLAAGTTSMASGFPPNIKLA